MTKVLFSHLEALLFGIGGRFGQAIPPSNTRALASSPLVELSSRSALNNFSDPKDGVYSSTGNCHENHYEIKRFFKTWQVLHIHAHNAG